MIRPTRREALRLAAIAAAGAAVPAGGRGVAPMVGRWSPPPAAPPPPLTPPEPGARSFGQAWRFHRGDIAMPQLRGHRVSYEATKAGGAYGAAAAVYDDADWPLVELPHDWAAAEVPDETQNIAQGYRARGIGWYRRGFRIDEALRGRYIELQFGGIATNATVWCNGIEVAHSWSGYAAIAIDLTAIAMFGDALNSVAIRVDADRFEGWWYEGAGAYRHVWLVDRAPVHIVTDGVHADPRQDAAGAWRVPVAATLYSIEPAVVSVRVVADLIDDAGRVIATASAPAAVRPLERMVATLDIAGFAPALWSVDTPNLYRVRTRVIRDGAVVDERVTPCGFRTAVFDAGRGFLLNGRPLKIKGVCIHQDHAGVGVAVPDALVWWRVQQLRRMGCNAIRSSHNAPSTALLDACDRLGMLVMDENRLFNVSPEYLAQLEWLVRRDRNRPSVILWSVFNEEPMEGTRNGYEMVRRASVAVKALDDSRAVTAAMSGGMFAPVNVGQAVDVVGLNYHHTDYDRFHREFPDRPMLSSEDTSAFMVRGEATTDEAAHIKAQDDTQHAAWGNSHRQAWQEIATRPFVAGGFVWTGFDYHGEPTPYAWPTKSSLFGIMDLCGFPKSAFWIHQAQWLDAPVLKILPHWNRTTGDRVDVLVATRLDRVVLVLNGRTVADAAVDPYAMFRADVAFEPGRLEARGYRGGRLVATDAVETTGPAIAIRLTPARTSLRGDGADAVPVTIEAIDARGRAVPTANLRVDLSVAGGRLIGAGNGDPNAAHSGKEPQIRLFNGLAQAIVQSVPGSRGTLALTGTGAGVASGRVALGITPATLPSVAPGPLRFMVQGWRQSPVAATRPAAPGAIADNDMNSWQAVRAGDPPPFSDATGFVTLAVGITVPAAVTERGGQLVLRGVNGRAVLWTGGRQVAEKTAVETAPMIVPLARGVRHIDLALVIEALPAQRTGLPGLVYIEAPAS